MLEYGEHSLAEYREHSIVESGSMLEYREHSIAEYRERAEEPPCCLGVERLFHPGGKCVVSF